MYVNCVLENYSCCRVTRETADTHDFVDKRKEMFEFVEDNGL